MLTHIWLIPAITFVSFWVILFFGKRMPRGGSEVGVGALTVCFALSLVAFFQWIGHDSRTPIIASHSWFDFGDVKVTASTLVDGLTIAILLVVSIISLCVHIFSTNYMHDDKRFTHYFAALSLFTTGMFILVTAGNTLQVLVGWEIMG